MTNQHPPAPDAGIIPQVPHSDQHFCDGLCNAPAPLTATITAVTYWLEASRAVSRRSADESRLRNAQSEFDASNLERLALSAEIGALHACIDIAIERLRAVTRVRTL